MQSFTRYVYYYDIVNDQPSTAAVSKEDKEWIKILKLVKKDGDNLEKLEDQFKKDRNSSRS